MPPLLEVVLGVPILHEREEEVRDVVRRVEAHAHQPKDVGVIEILHYQTFREELILSISRAKH